MFEYPQICVTCFKSTETTYLSIRSFMLQILNESETHTWVYLYSCMLQSLKYLETHILEYPYVTVVCMVLNTQNGVSLVLCYSLFNDTGNILEDPSFHVTVVLRILKTHTWVSLVLKDAEHTYLSIIMLMLQCFRDTEKHILEYP